MRYAEDGCPAWLAGKLFLRRYVQRFRFFKHICRDVIKKIAFSIHVRAIDTSARYVDKSQNIDMKRFVQVLHVTQKQATMRYM